MRLFTDIRESALFLGYADTRTSTPVVRLEFVFLENELIVDALNLREIEVWLGYQNRAFRNVRLMPARVSEMHDVRRS